MENKRYYFTSFLYLFLLLWMFSAFAQNNTTVTDQLAEQLQSVSKNNASDLVYLQTSKGIYETEEDVWFKGYVLDAQYFTPSARSKTLFVQLTEDKTDKVVWQKKYEIENGFVNGHLFLENSLAEGTYTLSAYSSYSFTKEPAAFYALKKIKIVQTINHKIAVAPVEKDSLVHFATFAEGGQLISGINSNLAFKTVNCKGLPVDVSGTLFENNTPLLHFKSSHAGMGVLAFTPDINKKYHIQLTEPVTDKYYEIAPIAASGKVLCLISNTKDGITFKITQSGNLKEERVYLRLQIRGVVYSIATGMLKKELTIKIPLKEVPQGIAEVTLFNEAAIPLAERLVFVNQDQKLTIKAELNKSDFTTREKANLKIKVTDQNGQPIVAHLGLSVYDAIYQNKQDAKNIQTHYLLSTQLKGNIYNPAYYFNEQNKNRKQALDVLMLTQGWRNYVWNEDNLKAQGNNQVIVFDEIKGKVRLAKPDTKVTDAIGQKGISVFSADESKGSDFILTDSTGVFTILPNDLKKAEGGFTYMKLMTPSKPKCIMSIKDFSFDAINNGRKMKNLIYPLAVIEKSTNLKEVSSFIGRESINKLKEVVITSKKKGLVFRDKYIGKLDSLYRLNYSSGDFVCPMTGILNHARCNFVVSGTSPIEGKTYIEYTEGGREVIYRYPDLTEARLLEMFNIAMVEGYYRKKVFYEAIYDEVTITDATPDYRNTLFWKPDIITNENGEANVDFFCSDINSLFLGNIEGVNADGLLGTGNFEFKVRK